MKALQYISALGLSLLMLGACNSDLEKVSYNKDSATPATLAGIDPAYTLDAKKQNEVAITFDWQKANMGYPAEVTTSLEMALKGKNFANKVVLSSSKTDSKYAVKVGELNSKIIGLLATLGMEVEAADFEFRVSSTIADAAGVLLSNVVTTHITPYSGERDYPKVWLIGDYCGWDHANSQFLFSFAENEVYEGIADFGDKASNGFKLTGIAGWEDSSNWGTDGDKPAPEAEAASITLIASGGSGNIGCYSHRYYQFTFNTTTLLLKKGLSFDSMGIIGDGAGSWENDVVMDFDPVKQRFFVDVELFNGEIKFRTDGQWNNNWGGKDGALTAGGDDIAVTPGHYRVYVNLNNPLALTYELSDKEYGK